MIIYEKYRHNYNYLNSAFITITVTATERNVNYNRDNLPEVVFIRSQVRWRTPNIHQVLQT